MKVSKNSKYQTHEKLKRPRWGPFRIFYHPLFQNIKNLKVTLWRKKVSKNCLTTPKKTERGTLLEFFNIQSVATSILSSKIEGEPFRDFFQKKVSQCQKTETFDPLVPPSIVCNAEKEEKPFWFSSLGQMIQFGTIKFRRT